MTTATGSETRHWLLKAAEQAGLTHGLSGGLDADTPMAKAWPTVARSCGVGEEQLARHVATHFGLAVADFTAVVSRALKLVPEALARRYNVFPLREDDRRLLVATSDPANLDVEQALGFASGRAPVFQVAAPKVIEEAIDSRYSPDRAVERLLHSVDVEALDGVSVVEEEQMRALALDEIETAPVVKLANLILREAVKRAASDIHVEPGLSGGTVRFRVDGVLRHFMPMPMAALNRLVSRIKILGGIDISDRLRPHDGRARIRVAERAYDLRVSTVPTRDAEKAVIRILDPECSLGLDDLGLAPHERDRLRQLLAYPDGIVLVTGPTGSGKTTTQYAALRELASREVNITTVEDPVEYELAGITQIQVETRRGVTFASALRAVLRQDPDVILVGEIRDEETAEVAVRASQTGHLVLATLHTNDAIGVVSRLCHLGLDRGSVAESLRGALAQRLVRRVCQHCAQRIAPEGLSDEENRLAARYGVKPAVRAIGCVRCGGTGYRGRVPLMEIAVTTPRLEELIARRATSGELRRAAVAAGMRPMREAAGELVHGGTTTLQEVERALGEMAQAASSATDRPHILVVDDDALIRKLAGAVLEKNNLRVSEAVDGVAALELLARGEHYDLMVLDLQMPRMGGFDVLHRVRGNVATAGLSVVVLTGSDDGDAEVRVMDGGADDYVRKPIDPPCFVARIKAALRRAGAQLPVSGDADE